MNELFDKEGNPLDIVKSQNPPIEYLFGVNKQYTIKTKSMYVNNFRHLLGMVISLFDFEGLGIPTYELLYRLILQGYATIYNHPVYGLVTSWGGLYGVSIYNHYTKWVCTQAILGSVRGTIGVNGAVFFCTPQDVQGGKSIILDRIQYYAKMLTDIDVSLDVYVINTRKTTAIVARDDQSQATLEFYYKNMENGENYVPLCASGVLPTHDSLLKSQEYRGSNASELLELKERVMQNFCNEFSIPKFDEKKERMIEKEIGGSREYLNWNVYAMLDGLTEGVSMFNSVFNKSAKVIFRRGELN